ncbi:MAG: hypothetical protein FWD68_05160 [Alphaproteobacteria bacterium]|nr:hypothetical protein [Alphaproteobacteria bacterium]
MSTPGFGRAQDESLSISWEVRNRFRLFREERDFLLHLETARHRDILGSEQALELQSEGRGWARNMVSRLCIDLQGRIASPCRRDNVDENYLAPADHPVTIRLQGTIPVGATCAWSFDNGDGPTTSTRDCLEPFEMRVTYGRRTLAAVDVSAGDDPTQHIQTEIQVRDIFIAGMGDSIASGEGNPDRAIALADEGFCFRSYFGTGPTQYYRPSRAGFQGTRACGDASDSLASWQRQTAVWLNAACHRSLYSYQTRTAITLAVRNPHIAVTYLPLACTGATLREGVLGPMRARECQDSKNGSCSRNVNAQIEELNKALRAARSSQPERKLDLILLSAGANDIHFSGLVADVLIEPRTLRGLLSRSGVITGIDTSRSALRVDLPKDFRRLRQALKPLVGGDLSHVIYVSYANPALAGGGQPCPGGPAGFDIHPAFKADPERLARVSAYVDAEFLPQLKAIATCSQGVLCDDPRLDAMSFVDAHQSVFADHGFCARAATDPEFDRLCFSDKGTSFSTDFVEAASQPLTCGIGASHYRAYLPRARWIRDANDSYFAAMTYPQGLSVSQPTDIHDATWGILSAVYGGAVHPSAEGHAAMADAVLPAATALLGLSAASTEVTTE